MKHNIDASDVITATPSRDVAAVISTMKRNVNAMIVAVPLGGLGVARFYEREMLLGYALAVHRGEVLGISGLIGAGRSELAEAVCGIAPRLSGRVLVDGQAVAGDRLADLAERVLLAWRLSLEQWQLSGHPPHEPGLCRSVARVTRR